MDAKGIEVVRQHAERIYDDRQQVDAYVDGFVDGADWLKTQMIKTLRGGI